MNRGFTIVELLISIAIFVSMTALVVAKYGNFNQSTLLTDTAYDIALVLHLAQTYGMSVKNAGNGGINFNVPYGVSFNSSATSVTCGQVTTDDKNVVLFADSDPVYPSDGLCNDGGTVDTNINSYTITHGAKISSMCIGPSESNCEPVSRLDISYMRPNPEALICGFELGAWICSAQYSEVTILGTDGSTRTVAIRENGQVSVSR